MLSREWIEERFKKHVATFTDYGNIKILDFKKPGTSDWQIRFLFEEDYYRLHISGDLGELIAYNYNNMTYEDFGTDFVHNPGYFERKIRCCSRDLYNYDYDKAKEDLKEYLAEYDWAEEMKYSAYDTMEETRDYEIECILDDLNTNTGLGSKAYDRLSEIDADCFEWISEVGKEKSEILNIYLTAFELAQKQLEETKNLESKR
jgi:hypothetical protein